MTKTFYVGRYLITHYFEKTKRLIRRGHYAVWSVLLGINVIKLAMCLLGYLKVKSTRVSLQEKEWPHRTDCLILWSTMIVLVTTF